MFVKVVATKVNEKAMKIIAIQFILSLKNI